jgi:tRNA pseudouridine65 synthase
MIDFTPKEPCDVSVLFRDEYLLAVDKPSGLLVHRGWGRDSVVLVDLVKEMLGVEVVHPLHRLDRGTSGVVLFALDGLTARRMGSGFEDGSVEKHYMALVRGETPIEGFIDHPIPRREGGRRVEAKTNYRRLAIAKIEPRHVSWVEAIPMTGRLHQVRRHLKHINHPVIGDANYGKGAINREMEKRWGLKRLALHARSLSLIHPKTGELIVITSPLPADLDEPLRRMGLCP